MDLEALRQAVLHEYRHGVIAREEDLVVRRVDLLRKFVGKRDLRPAADQLDLAGLLQPAVGTRDQAVFVHDKAVATASTLTGNKLGKRARVNSNDRIREEVMLSSRAWSGHSRTN